MPCGGGVPAQPRIPDGAVSNVKDVKPGRPHLLLAILAAAIAVAHPAVAGEPAAPRRMTATDLLSLASAAAPLPSPDGSTVLYKVRSANWARNGMTTTVWRIAGTGPAEQAKDLRGEIAWSPDGRSLAFTARRDGDGADQIYLHAPGGAPRRLTRLPTDASALQWSIDGRRIFFIANTSDDAETESRMKAGDDMFPFEMPRYRAILQAVEVASGRVTTIAGGDFDVRGYSAGRGDRIVFERAVSKLSDDQPRSELWLSDPGAGAPRRLTGNDYRERQVRLSPDGQTVLFLANADQGRYATVNTRLFVLDIADGTVRMLADNGRWAIRNAEWAASGKAIYFTAQNGVRTGLHAVSLAGGVVRDLDIGDFVISSPRVSRDGRTLVYLRASAKAPAEVVRLDPVRRTPPLQLSHLNDGLERRFLLPRQEALRWTGPGGQVLEGLVTYPLGYVAGRRYPLIVQSHGGPRTADQFGIFSYGRALPLLAAEGFVTLSVNYRGGTGYGNEFLRGMNGGYFRFADRDVLSGVDELVARGVADPARLGAMGWSAGGHMTARLITVTDRFRAAVVGAGAVDWASMYLGSDTRWERQEWFVTPPYGEQARRDLYLANSPLTTIDKVRTPTLILAGANDHRVPPAQSVMLYRALKESGVPTELYLAPREPHVFGELRHRLFQITVTMRWLISHVTGGSYVAASAPVVSGAPPEAAGENAVDESVGDRGG
jgi:dipeptidyl aminopeptidase/acylaminoacyl peptidase